MVPVSTSVIIHNALQQQDLGRHALNARSSITCG